MSSVVKNMPSVQFASGSGMPINATGIPVVAFLSSKDEDFVG